MSATPAVLVTGASTGIGAVYAQRFARRGHDLVLVARNVERMEALAATLRAEHGVAVDILPADLSNPVQRAAVETRLREDTQIGILVNNAGASLPGTFLDQPADDIERLIALNVTAPTRLAHAIAPRLAAQGSGAIINVGSVVGLAPEFGMAAYGATKSFILHLSQALNLQLGAQGVHVQAVLPAATRTEIWGHSGIDVETVQGVMEVEDLVDAALAGFDQGEPVTIPPLHDGAQWDGFEAARQTMAPGFAQSQPAPRYRQTA
ncbi:SDR family NAD(P)-dependent oxidoreductase [Altererythrobacter xixiisoli]|uniref:SDR family NAD(P)-dependent oxidoreductase n=1 Tax=Croceibacterium xixiisoli TaxID=1476466 RepID=A0A6I4TR61_9SPHN|nr:SDR family NAD(P)-dependent oxidoreductase [Croceibacterium xixiisoli]